MGNTILHRNFMKLSDYSNMINSLINQDEGCVILLKGAWGVGKTHFWDSFCAEYLSEKPSAYVTLFGKKNIDQIKNDALVQIYSRNKHIESVNAVLKKIKDLYKPADEAFDLNLGIYGNALGFALSLFKKGELKNNTICIDDFERKSNQLQLIEIIGFSSNLAERYGCKVVLIMDEDKIIKDRSIYELYKEKMVAYEIEFAPSQYELIGSIVSGVDVKYKEGVLAAISTMKETNLRTIKKITQRLRTLLNIVGNNFGESFCAMIGYKFSILIIVYCLFGSDGLSDVSFKIEETEQTKITPEQLKKDKLAKECRAKLLGTVSFYSDFDKLLCNFIKSYRIDANEFRLHAEYIEKNATDESIKTKIFKLLDDFTFDIHYSSQNYTENMLNIFRENKDRLLEIITLDSFNYIINSLSEKDHEAVEISKLRLEIMKNYVSSRIKYINSYEEYAKATDNDAVKYICASEPTIGDFLKEKLASVKKQLLTVENIISIMDRMKKNSGWDVEDENFLNTMPVDFVKINIEESGPFLKALIDFFKWRGTSISSFKPLYDTFEMAIKSIGEDAMGKFRYNRISSIFKTES